MIVTDRRTRYSLRCPVCGMFVAPMLEPDESVDCEDDTGLVQWWHRACWEQTISAEDETV